MEPGIHIDPPFQELQRLIDDVVATRAGLMVLHLRGMRTERQLANAMARISHGHRTADAMLPTPSRRWRAALLVAHIDASDSPQLIRRFGWGLPGLIESWRIQGVALTALVGQEGVRDLLLASIEGGRRAVATRPPFPAVDGSGLVPIHAFDPTPATDPILAIAPRHAAEPTMRDNLRPTPPLVPVGAPPWATRERSLGGMRSAAHDAAAGR